eukprot:1431648-Rhodomonas_salina.1
MSGTNVAHAATLLGLGNGSAFFNTSLWNDWAQGYATATSAKGLWLWNGVEVPKPISPYALAMRCPVLTSRSSTGLGTNLAYRHDPGV